MKIQITQEHIDKGEICNSYECPIALAVQEHFPKEKITVARSVLYINKKAHILPKEAISFIYDFDMKDIHGKEAKPFTFEINVGE